MQGFNSTHPTPCPRVLIENRSYFSFFLTYSFFLVFQLTCLWSSKHCIRCEGRVDGFFVFFLINGIMNDYGYAEFGWGFLREVSLKVKF